MGFGGSDRRRFSSVKLRMREGEGNSIPSRRSFGGLRTTERFAEVPSAGLSGQALRCAQDDRGESPERKRKRIAFDDT
jgi:hypothetical protein